MVRTVAPKKVLVSNKFEALSDSTSEDLNQAAKGAPQQPAKGHEQPAKGPAQRDEKAPAPKEDVKKSSGTVDPIPAGNDDSEDDEVDIEVEFAPKRIKNKRDAMAASMLRQSGIYGTKKGPGALTYGSQGEAGHLEY